MREWAQALGAALGVGLLVGLERGWRERAQREGRRVAGLRTFGLVGLLGGVLALLQPASAVLPAVGLACVALLFAIGYRRAFADSGSLSITTAVAGLVTFCLGVLAAQGHVVLAVAAALVVALLLDLKEELHGGLQRIQPAELNAVLTLGVLTAVVLPLLPDRGYGPYAALNPFRLWVAVILVAALSLAGHVAMRLRGEHQGLLWTGLLGGLASSTAATLSLARFAREEPRLAQPAAAAIVAACGVMFLRMAVVISALQPALAWRLGAYLALLGAASLLVAGMQWRARPRDGQPTMPARAKLFDLPTALGFAAMLGLVAMLVRAANDNFGTAGLYALAFVSGLADVDAIVISSVQVHAQGGLDARSTAGAILLAALANMVLKAGMAWRIGGGAVGRPVALAFVAVAVTGVAAAAVVAQAS